MVAAYSVCSFDVQFRPLVSNFHRCSLSGLRGNRKIVFPPLLTKRLVHCGRHNISLACPRLRHNAKTRQPTVSLLYVLATAFANRESSRVKPHIYENDWHALVKMVYV